MKKLLVSIFFCYSLTTANSQSITPDPGTALCPNVEYTFSAVITKPYSSMIGEGCIVTQLPFTPVGTSFTFKGKFSDANSKQTFRIYHPDNTSTPFEFKRIKSLFYRVLGCAGIEPTPATINVPLCQIVNIPVSFSSISYATEFESPVLCFAKITDYEYQLPANWSIGMNSSNGSNWIKAPNSVTVTTDLTTGNNGVVKIRPSNIACGSGLNISAGYEKTISISRAAPVMSITPNGNQAFICLNSSKTFTLVGLPANATVTSWISSDPSIATVPSPSTGSSVLVTSGGISGSFTLTVNVSQCGINYPVSLLINAGINVPAVYGISSNYVSSNNNQYQYYTNPYEYGLGQVYQPRNENVLFYSTIDNTFITNPTWSVSGTYNLFYSSPNSFSLYMSTPNSGPYSRNIATVRLLASSGCGTVDKLYQLHAIVSSTGFNITASPNPATGTIKLNITKSESTASNSTKPPSLALENISTGKTILSLYDVNSKILIKQWNYNETDAVAYSLNIGGIKSGWYVLKMDRDNTVTTTKIFIQ